MVLTKKVSFIYQCVDDGVDRHKPTQEKTSC